MHPFAVNMLNELNERGSGNTLQEQLEQVRHEAVARVVPHVPEILDSLVDKAKRGNVSAARLVLEMCGLVRRPAAMVATQINITQEEIDRLRRGLEGYSFEVEA